MIRGSDGTDTTCRRLAPLLLKAPDGELSLEERAAVETHLAFCEPCAREARDLAEVGDQLRLHAASGAHLPSGERMAARIMQRESPGTLGMSWLSPARAWVAAAALAVALVVWRFGQPAQAPQPPSEVVISAPEPPPMLFVVDDEVGGRRVMLAATGSKTREAP